MSEALACSRPLFSLARAELMRACRRCARPREPVGCILVSRQCQRLLLAGVANDAVRVCRELLPRLEFIPAFCSHCLFLAWFSCSSTSSFASSSPVALRQHTLLVVTQLVVLLLNSASRKLARDSPLQHRAFAVQSLEPTQLPRRRFRSSTVRARSVLLKCVLRNLTLSCPVLRTRKSRAWPECVENADSDHWIETSDLRRASFSSSTFSSEIQVESNIPPRLERANRRASHGC